MLSIKREERERGKRREKKNEKKKEKKKELTIFVKKYIYENIEGTSKIIR